MVWKSCLSPLSPDPGARSAHLVKLFKAKNSKPPIDNFQKPFSKAAQLATISICSCDPMSFLNKFIQLMIETRKQNYSNKGVQVIRLINKSVNQQA